MNKDFRKGLALGLILVGVLGGVSHWVIIQEDKKIERYRKIMKILAAVAEGLEEHVDPVVVREIMDKHEFDVMMLIEFKD